MMTLNAILDGTSLEARPYQKEVVQDAFDMFNGSFVGTDGKVRDPHRSVLIESPTGSGKTSMALMTAKYMQSRIDGLAVGWMAMRRNLLSQAASENTRHKINVENAHFVSMFDKHPTSLLEAKASGRKIMLIVDEAQHDAAASMAHQHNLLEPDFILGMTATPFRTDRVKLTFDAIIKKAGVHQLIQDGYLSRFHHYSIPKWDVETVAQHYMMEPETWGKSIFYFHSLDECYALYNILRENSQQMIDRLRADRPDLSLGAGLVEIVTGSSSESEREAQLQRYRNGEVACLINCMVLTEGFDDPTLETAWVRDSGRGPSMQMAGRAFRKHPEASTNPRFKFKKIVQSKETSWPILKTAMADQQFLWQSDSWRSLTINPMLNQINANARMAIAQATVELPKFLLDRQQKGRRAPRFTP